MKKSNPLFILIVILVPLLIITSGMRIALSPIFFNLEYRLPNFPPDSFGFTLSDRLQWADVSIDFISGRVDENTFRTASFPDGTQLFNEREIAHMIDVRNLTVIMLWVWRILMVIFLLSYFYTKREGISHLFLTALGFGAKITIGIILAILLFLAINFNQLFTAFHRIFFEGDTWLFYISDTLIRLFPLKFWQDLFIFIGGFSLAASICLLLLSAKRSLIKRA